MWFAHVTVANVVVRNDQFLMVKEKQNGKTVINQPAGHLEDGETLVDALIRETLEETRWEVRPVAALGVSQFVAPNGETYIRHSFLSGAAKHHSNSILDSDIDEVCWMSYDEIESHASQLRSPLVLNDLKRYREGTRFDIESLYFHAQK